MFWVHENPFRNLAESVATSNVLDTRDAFDVSWSFYTNSGTSSAFTYQVSNYGGDKESIPEASWSNWTYFAGPSGASVVEPPLAFRWNRIIRSASGASYTHDWSKTVRTQ